MPDDLTIPTFTEAKRKLIGIRINIDPDTGTKSAQFQFAHFYRQSNGTVEIKSGATVQADDAQLADTLTPAVLGPIRTLAKTLADAEEAP